MKKSLIKLTVLILTLCSLTFTFAACGSENYTKGLKYKLYDEKEYYVVGFEECYDTKINIPPVYNGKPVVGIGSGVFTNCSEITEIKIPASVTYINDDFSGCTKLAKIEVAEGNEKYFSKYDSLYEIRKDEREGTVTNWLLKVPAMKSGSINIAKNDNIYGDSFYECEKLENIDVDVNNERYFSKSGILYSKDLNNTNVTEILYVPKAKSGSVTIDKNVQVISGGKFDGREKITDIHFERKGDWKVDGKIINVTDSKANAYNLTKKYAKFDWRIA